MAAEHLRPREGSETFSATPALPEGAIPLTDLTIGGKTTEQLEKALASGGINVRGYAEDMLRSRAFTTLKDQQNVSLVKVSVSDLYLRDFPTTGEIYMQASSLGLD